MAKSKKKNNIFRFSSTLIGERRYRALILFGIQDRFFLRAMVALIVLAAIFYPNPSIAMWLGFSVAAYSVVANDSIQTIGTFIVSNKDKKWWVLWLFIGGIFLLTVFYSWYSFDGDVSFQRLSSKGFSQTPSQYHFLQIAAPIVLLLLTRLRMPVSTTFMLLSVFSSSAEGIVKVAEKSFLGYVISFITAFLVWFLLKKGLKKLDKGIAKPYWTILQWLISGTLWCMWIMHDAANVAIFLPRSLTFWQFVVFAMTIFIGLGILFYNRGDRMQKIVSEKTDVSDVRAATIVDLVYAAILLVFINLSTIPMSTTWVFIGLLGGRELAKALSHNHEKRNVKRKKAFEIIGKDVLLAAIGLFVSVVMALLSNHALLQEILAFINF